MNEDAIREQIIAALREGKSNAAIARALYIGVRAVARIRKDAGIPPTPRCGWTRQPHPQGRTILVLLGEGQTNVEIHRKTGADVATIARIRNEGGFGPATIIRRGTRTHPKEAQIRDLIAKGWRDTAISLELKADRTAVRRIRRDAGVPTPPVQPLTLEQKWAERTRPIEGGHLEWTGERGNTASTPVMRYKGEYHSPAAIAFRIKHGHDPVGYVYAECNVEHCVAPDCVDDEAGRARTREQFRYFTGGQERKERCVHGHDQAEHGRYESDGTAYCGECKRLRKQAERQGVVA